MNVENCISMIASSEDSCTLEAVGEEDQGANLWNRFDTKNALSHDREAFDDPEIRVQALEAIYLISLQEAGRRALWSVNGPRILQVGYEDEEDPKVMEAYESIGSLLVNNPNTEEPGTQNVKL